MTNEFKPKPPLHFKLDDFKLVVELIEDIDESDWTNEERSLHWKASKIIDNIERARKRRENNGN